MPTAIISGTCSRSSGNIKSFSCGGGACQQEEIAMNNLQILEMYVPDRLKHMIFVSKCACMCNCKYDSIQYFLFVAMRQRGKLVRKHCTCSTICFLPIFEMSAAVTQAMKIVLKQNF